MDQVGSYGPLIINAVKAVVVLIIGWIVAGMVSKLVRRRIVSHPQIDDTIGGFAASIVR
ncbi:MAG: mechanosensitive ion channel family protein, partial [Pseudomonadota bacterium]